MGRRVGKLAAVWCRTSFSPARREHRTISPCPGRESLKPGQSSRTRFTVRSWRGCRARRSERTCRSKRRWFPRRTDHLPVRQLQGRLRPRSGHSGAAAAEKRPKAESGNLRNLSAPPSTSSGFCSRSDWFCSPSATGDGLAAAGRGGRDSTIASASSRAWWGVRPSWVNRSRRAKYLASGHWLSGVP
jgi:hypothetical protein